MFFRGQPLTGNQLARISGVQELPLIGERHEGWAVVVDDYYQGITQVVRGADLLDSTAWQLCLQKAMGFSTPEYMHLPVALSADGKKLGKRLQTDPVNRLDPVSVVTQALRFLGHHPPAVKSLTNLWDWAFSNWNRDLIPRNKSILPDHNSSG